MPPVNWIGNVYHGLPLNLLPFAARPSGGYLAFLGRISPEKGPDRAIAIAARAGLPLRMAAKVDDVDRAYWDEVIAPLLATSSNVEFVGEINDQQKARFLGDASALLFPIDWPEPFGLVMIEAMSCGTPVVAYRRGSVPEVIDDGVSGYVVDTVDGAVAAVECALALDRAGVRAAFESRFTVERMVDDYLDIYHRLAGVGIGDGILPHDDPGEPEIQAVA
jgi:glycosyltransferase involved in cell wall biosynthesis